MFSQFARILSSQTPAPRLIAPGIGAARSLLGTRMPDGREIVNDSTISRTCYTRTLLLFSSQGPKSSKLEGKKKERGENRIMTLPMRKY